MSSGTFVFLLISAACFSQVFSASYKCSGIAEYSLSFYGMWSNNTHPNAFPFMGHFSPLIGCSHEDAYTMWAPGMKASQGVEAVAEMGNATTLYDEINMAIMNHKTAWKAFMASGPINGTGHVMGLDVEVTRDFSLVSLVTMLAPSPDWFTGIMKMDLCNTLSGTWRDNVTVTMLQPWDAGTEEGNTFGTNNAPTNPVDDITLITKMSDTPFKNVPQANIPTLGKLVFQRKNKPVMTQQCSGEETYSVKFEGMWTAQSHPNGYPANSNPHFSPPVGATHTYRYQFWGDMIRASPGVKEVAEIGLTTSLYNEIKTSMKPNFVFRSYKADTSVGATGSMTIEMKVKDSYSRVSFITMIAPSPDWFVGVDGYELCGSNGRWKDKTIVHLFAWDAGTDNGFNFASANNATMPPDVIKMITANSDTVIKDDASKPFARITFQREQVLVPTSSITRSQSPSTENGSQSPSTENGSQSPSTENGSQPPSTENGSQPPSPDNSGENEKSEGNSARNPGCGNVDLIFLAAAVLQAFLIVRG